MGSLSRVPVLWQESWCVISEISSFGQIGSLFYKDVTRLFCGGGVGVGGGGVGVGGAGCWGRHCEQGC